MVQAQRMVNAVHISDIAKITKRTDKTVRNWMNGEAIRSTKNASLLPDFLIPQFAEKIQPLLGKNYEDELTDAIQAHELSEGSQYYYSFLTEKAAHEGTANLLDRATKDVELMLNKQLDYEVEISQWKSKANEWKSKLEEWKQGGNEVETENGKLKSEIGNLKDENLSLEADRKLVETKLSQVEMELGKVEADRKHMAYRLESLEGSGNLKIAGRKFYAFTQSLVFLYVFMLVMIAAETIAHFVVTSSVFDTNPVHAYLAAGLFQVAAFLVYTNDNLKAAFGFDAKQVLNTITGYNFLMNIAVLFWSFDWAMDAPQLVANIIVRILIAIGFAMIIKVIGTVIISKQKQVA